MNEDPDSSVSFESEKIEQPKKVRFGASPAVYSPSDWVNGEFKDNYRKIHTDSETLLPTKSCLKDTGYQLRTPVAENATLSWIAISCVIVFLLGMFVAIWYVVDKLLMLEIENQMNTAINKPNAMTLIPHSSVVFMFHNPSAFVN